MSERDENDRLLSPEATPGGLDSADAGGSGSGIRRINNWPVILFASVVAGFLLMIVKVGTERSQQTAAAAIEQPEKKPADKHAQSALGEYLTSNALIQAPPPKAEEQPQPPPSSPPAEATALTVPVVRPGDLDLPPLPTGAVAGTDEAIELVRRVQQKKIQDFEAALRARTGVRDGSQPGGAAARAAPQSDSDRLAAVRAQLASAGQGGDPTAAYHAKLAALRAGGGEAADLSGGMSVSVLGGAGGAASMPNSARNSLSQFDSQERDRWRLDNQVQAPRSPYELRAGFVIPATMISGINSDLPGQIIAQVSQDVWDTATGRHLLIPMGSRLVGSYSSNVEYGQSRVMIGWQRIVFPDGKALDIGAMAGADQAGYAGAKDKVNHHYLRVFGSALLMSVITAGVELSQGDNSTGGDQQRAGDALSEALGQQLGQAMAQMIRKNLNISPTIEIRPGYRFNVMVSKDLAFNQPYRQFAY